MKTIIFIVEKSATFNQATSELEVEIFRVSPRLPLAKNLEKAFYDLPSGEYNVHIYKTYATILHNGEVVKDIKVKPFLSETEWQLACSNNGVLSLTYHSQTVKKVQKLLAEGIIESIFRIEKGSDIVVKLW